MAGPYDKYQTDTQVEKSGVILNYGDFKIRIARAGGANAAYLAALDTAMRPYRKQVARGQIDRETSDRIVRDVFAETVILGWSSQQYGEGKIPGPDGNPLEFNRENVKQLLTDLPDLFADIRADAADYTLFREEAIEADVGKFSST